QHGLEFKGRGLPAAPLRNVLHCLPDSFSKFHIFFSGYKASVYLEPFPVAVQSRGYITTHPVARVGKRCGNIRKDASLSVGSGNMDKPETPLRMPQFLQKSPDGAQAHFTAVPLLFLNVGTRLSVIHDNDKTSRSKVKNRILHKSPNRGFKPVPADR